MSMLSELLRPGGNSSGSDKRFIVSLTPTAADYSGTMDKTVAEIYEAFQAGRDVWFSLTTPQWTISARCTVVWEKDDYQYPSFNAMIVNNDDVANLLMYACTGVKNAGTDNRYFVSVYSINPFVPL